MDARSNKRRRNSIRISDDEEDDQSSSVESTAEAWVSAKQKRTLGDKERASRGSISPPPTRRIAHLSSTEHVIDHLGDDGTPPEHTSGLAKNDQHPMAAPLMASPIHLSTVEGLSAPHNIDTVSLRDILGDPLIEECWLFSYLIDVDFIM